MSVRRTLSLLAVAFVIMVGVAAPASATEAYPITGGTETVVEGTKTGQTGVKGTKTGQTGVKGTKTGQTTEGSRTPTGVAGLAETGAELGTLWIGLGLLVTGGLIVTVSRNRRRVTA